MPVPVLHVPPGLNRSDVLPGRAPRGRDWREAGLLLNWLLGRGGQMLTAWAPNQGSAILPGYSQTYAWASRTRWTATQRMWGVRIKIDSTSGTAEGTFTDASGTSHTWAVAFSASDLLNGTAWRTLWFREDIAARVAGKDTGTVTVAVVSFSAVIVDSIQCVEVPRAELETGAAAYERGSQIGTLVARSAIWDGTDGDGESVAEIARWLGSVSGGIIDECGRGCLFFWSTDTGDAWSTTSTSYASVFLLPPHVLARKLYNGETARKVSWRVYARATNKDGTFRVSSMLAGDSDTATITAGAGWGWSSAVRLISVECESTTSADGNQTAGAFERLMFEGVTTPTGTLEVAAIWVGEDD